MLHLALYQPIIPPNTGNIARQCVGMAAALHIIQPAAFKLTEHAARRAGLDYWTHADVTIHPSPDHFLHWLDGRRPWLITKRGEVRYDHAPYADGDVLLFGNETKGLPDAWHQRWPDRRLHIPLLGPARSYNLSNAAAIILAHASLTAGLYDQHPHQPDPT